MSTRRKWTDEEEQVLISQVRNNPNNLSRAFRATSDVIDRSSHSIEQHWYTKTRHLEPVFMTVGSKTMNVNSKNTVKYNNTERVKLPIWRRILRLLGL